MSKRGSIGVRWPLAIVLALALVTLAGNSAAAQDSYRNVLGGTGLLLVGILAAGNTALCIVEGVTWKDRRATTASDLAPHWALGNLGVLGGALTLGFGITTAGGQGNERWTPALISVGALSALAGATVIGLGIRRLRVTRQPPPPTAAVSLAMAPGLFPGGGGLAIGGRWSGPTWP